MSSQNNNAPSLNPPNDSKGKTAPNEISFPDDSDAPWIPPGQASLSLDLLAGDLIDFEKLLSQDESGKTLSSISYGKDMEALLTDDSKDKDNDSLTSFLDKLLNKPQNTPPAHADGVSSSHKSASQIPPLPARPKSDGALNRINANPSEHIKAQSATSAPKIPPLPARPKSDGALTKIDAKDDSRTADQPQKSAPKFPSLRTTNHEGSSPAKETPEDDVHDTVEFAGEDEKLLDERTASELPADIRKFEGTNVIYVQSGVFDTLLENEEISKKLKSGKISLENKLKLSHEIHPNTKVQDDSNVIGIVSSGILPNVDIDKSFDTPCLELDDDSDTISIEGEAVEVKENEVFVSRISQKGEKAKIESTSQEGLNPAPKDGIKVQTEKAFGLPLPEAPETIHPDDNALISFHAMYRQFAVDHLSALTPCTILGTETDDEGLDEDVSALIAALADTTEMTRPRAIQVVSGCPFTFHRLIRAFVQKCTDDVPDLFCYTTIQPEQEYYLDIPTALMASRIGCFPTDSEDTRKRNVIRGVSHLLTASDRLWAQDILCMRFGLPKMVSAQKDIPQLSLRLSLDTLDLLLKSIESDAQQAPVLVVLSENFTTPCHPWRDVIRQIQTLNAARVLIVVQTDTKRDDFEDANTIVCSDLSADDRRVLVHKSLEPYNLPEDIQNRIAENAGNSFTTVRRTVHALRSDLADVDKLREAVKALPKTNDERDDLYLSSFSDDQKSFLCFGALLGQTFFLEDLIRIYALEPLPNEPFWSHEERRKWARRVSKELIEKGEILSIGDHRGLGTRFSIVEWKFFSSLMFRNEPETSRRICGCYAHLLTRRQADDSLIATAFENAQMWDFAAKYWLKMVQRMIQSLCFRSAHSLVAHRFEHIGPEDDIVYRTLLETFIPVEIYVGQYSEALHHAEMLTHLGFMLNDITCTCRGILLLSNIQRIMGDYDSAADNIKKAIQIAQKLENDHLTCNAYHTAAKLMYEAGDNGAFVGALRYTEKALEIMRKQRDLASIADIQVTCARIYLDRGEPDRALQAITEAYHAATVTGSWTQMPLVLCVYAQCQAELHQGDYLENLEQAKKLIEFTGIREHQFRFLNTQIQIQINSLQKKTVRDDLEQLAELCQQYPLSPWIIRYQLLKARFDFCRKNFQKTTKSLKAFFDTTAKYRNSYLISIGYALSAELNFEVYKRNLGKISIEKTHKLFRSATSMLENIGAWHTVAEVLRKYANFLEYLGDNAEAEKHRTRADKVDPYCK